MTSCLKGAYLRERLWLKVILFEVGMSEQLSPLLLIIHKDCCISFFVVLGAYTNFNRNCSLNNETALVVVYVNFFALKIEMCFTWLSDLMLHVVSPSLFSFCFNLCDFLVCMYG